MGVALFPLTRREKLVLIKKVLPTIAFLGFVSLTTNTFAGFFDLPVVYKNYETNKCVAIAFPKGLRDCKVIPHKHNVLYVDPDITYAIIRAYLKTS